jgi:hypothetical protein
MRPASQAIHSDGFTHRSAPTGRAGTACGSHADKPGIRPVPAMRTDQPDPVDQPKSPAQRTAQRLPNNSSCPAVVRTRRGARVAPVSAAQMVRTPISQRPTASPMCNPLGPGRRSRPARPAAWPHTRSPGRPVEGCQHPVAGGLDQPPAPLPYCRTCPVPPAAGPRRPSLPRWSACTGCATGSSRATSTPRASWAGPTSTSPWTARSADLAPVRRTFRSSGRYRPPSSCSTCHVQFPGRPGGPPGAT